jgi:DNA-binding response OmpR family regulator
MQALSAGIRSPIEKEPAVVCALVVDDEALLRWSLAETLADRGVHVLEARDASEALTILRQAPHAIDVVLLDLHLPDSADLSLLAAIRGIAPRATVLLMSAFARSEIVRDALDLGAFRVVNKPFDMEDISDLVAQAAVMSRRPTRTGMPSTGSGNAVADVAGAGGAGGARRSLARARDQPDHVGADREPRQQVQGRGTAADQTLDARRPHRAVRAGDGRHPCAWAV